MPATTTTVTPAPREILYLGSSTNGKEEYWAYTLDPDTGTFSDQPAKYPADFEQSYVKVDPFNKYLYGAQNDFAQIRIFSIDASNGALAETSGSPVRLSTIQNGGPLAVSPDGRFVFYSDTIKIATFAASGGSLTFVDSISDGTSHQYIDFAVDPAGKFLYALNRADSSGSEFSVFAIASTGSLTEIAGSPFTLQPNSAPWRMALDPLGRFLFSSFQNTRTMPAFRIDPSSGAVSSVPGSPFDDGKLFYPDAIVVHPTGKFLYANAVSGIVSFSIDQATGALTTIGTVQPYSGPSLAVDPSGKLLISTGSRGGSLVVYKIDQSTGILSVIGPPFQGAPPGEGNVTIIRLP